MTVSDAPDAGVITEPWRDQSLPIADRVSDLLARMTLAEKLAQLYSAWLSGPADGNDVAPLQGEFTEGMPPFDELIRDGLGQLTRVLGSRPLHPDEGARALAGCRRGSSGPAGSAFPPSPTRSA